MRINLISKTGSERVENLEADEELLAKGPIEEVRCPGCDGRGKYVGFLAVEDPCQRCCGTGFLSPQR